MTQPDIKAIVDAAPLLDEAQIAALRAIVRQTKRDARPVKSGVGKGTPHGSASG
jgi:hypothetical protein